MENTPRVLAGRYEVGELIGRGGMAEVHIGHDSRLGRTVAIKVLRSDLARDPSFLARFRREAQSAAALNHPAIVAVYDTGEDSATDMNGQPVHIPFIVMEYVEGHTVRDILADGAAVPIEEAVEITVGVLSALEYSHHAGIVHRDIKPANVMITPTGAVKVMDFGIARAVADSAATMTQGQAVIGTAQYLSPEQARGEQVDARSDLYSTGCVLFELLTGRPPFIGDSSIALAYQHVGQEAQRPSEHASDVPDVLDRITLKALTKNRDDRYSSAAEFRADLEAAMRGGAVSAPAVGALAAGAAAGYAATQVMGPAGGTQVMQPASDSSPWGPTGLPADQTAVAGAAGPPGNGDGEEEQEPKRKALMWTLIAVAVVALAAIITFLLMRGEGAPDLVEVPEMPANVSPAEAERLLADVGLEFEQRVDGDSNEPEGAFTYTDPDAGTEVEVGSAVLVYFSGGPDTFALPDLTGMSEEQARSTLSENDLVVGEVTQSNDPSVPGGDVISTSPEAGQAVNPGDAVDLEISTGQVELPNLIGETEDEARRQLEALGLTWNRQTAEAEDANDIDRVINQSPQAGTVDQGRQVTLTIGVEMAAQQTQVPDVVGLSTEEALDRLGQSSLNDRQQTSGSEEYCSGYVAAQDPPAGTTLEEGSSVTITVSTGAQGQNCPPGSATPEPTEPEDDGEGDNETGDALPSLPTWPPSQD